MKKHVHPDEWTHDWKRSSKTAKSDKRKKKKEQKEITLKRPFSLSCCIKKTRNQTIQNVKEHWPEIEFNIQIIDWKLNDIKYKRIKFPEKKSKFAWN